MRLCLAAEMRELDASAISHYGIPGAILMEHAGRGTFLAMRSRFGARLAEGVAVLCGRGNNGGDGFVIARHLHIAGYPVEITLLSHLTDLQGDAALNARIAVKLGIHVHEVTDLEDWKRRRHAVLRPPIVVDALLGTGLNAEIQGLFRLVIEDLNDAQKEVVAVDIPSGLHATTGRPQDVAVRAALTTTYGLAKLGLLMDPALAYVGELQVIEISLPQALMQLENSHDRLMTASMARALLPARPRWGHKGTFGHVAVVAGSQGKGGAAVLAAHAALRAGAGLVTLVVPRSTLPSLAGLWPEVMVEAIEDGQHGHFMPDTLPHIVKLCAGKSAVALGPGLSHTPQTEQVVRTLVSELRQPLILDADALNALAGGIQAIHMALAPVVLTPHPGELARLLNCTPADIWHDRPGSARQLARQTRATVVLKGARTLVARADGRLTVNATGNSGMAKGGSGDVLTGILAALCAQGVETEPAAALGVYVHGLAGDLAARAVGSRAMVASDLVEALGMAFDGVESGEVSSPSTGAGRAAGG